MYDVYISITRYVSVYLRQDRRRTTCQDTKENSK